MLLLFPLPYSDFDTHSTTYSIHCCSVPHSVDSLFVVVVGDRAVHVGAADSTVHWCCDFVPVIYISPHRVRLPVVDFLLIHYVVPHYVD